MTVKIDQSALPLAMQQRSTDEYGPLAYTPADVRVIRRIQDRLDDAEFRLNIRGDVLAGERLGEAIGLRAINDEWGAEFYVVPQDAERNVEVARATFDGPETVVDVQTHMLAGHAAARSPLFDRIYAPLMPDWWKELDRFKTRDLTEYLDAVFLRSETAVAVLTSGPGTDPAIRQIYNDEMVAVRQLLEGLGGEGRLLTHSVVHADEPREISAMEEWRDEFSPVGWKVYTPGRLSTQSGASGWRGSGASWVSGWMLDDEESGFAFLERARSLDVPLICAHKGLTGMVDNGTARDIGPAAKAFPDLTFVVYHSSFETPSDLGPGTEGAYNPVADYGVDCLIRSIEEAGVAGQRNVYAELGTTWFCLMRRPREAAHVLGKLIARLGEDNVVWGSDSVWYGSPQATIDAFRVFQIPDDMCAEFGYAKLTAEVKAKILGGNAARIYGIDLERARRQAERDDLAWVRQAIVEYESGRLEGLH